MSKNNSKSTWSQHEKRSNYYFYSNILSILIFIVIGFVATKCVIYFFGEVLNAQTRFIIQFIKYLSFFQNGFVIIYRNRMIASYVRGDTKDVSWNFYLLKSFLLKVCIALSICLVGACLLLAFLLKTSNVSLWPLFVVFITMCIKPIFSILIAIKYNVFFLAINRGYIYEISNIITQLILYTVFFVLLFYSPPKLVYTNVNGDYVLNIDTSSIGKIYNLAIAYVVLGLQPFFLLSILKFFINKYLLEFDLKERPNKNQIKEIRKKVHSGIMYSLLIELSFLVFMSTDEFAMLALKNNYNELIILQKINIYTLYSTIIFSLTSLGGSYIETKKYLFAQHSDDNKKNKEFVDTLKLKGFIISVLIFTFSFLATPFIVNAFFAPNDSSNYFDLNFSLPLAIFAFITSFNLVSKLELEVRGHLRFLAYAFIFEAIFNICLTFTISRILGIYWILWATNIASFCRLIIFEIYLKNKEGYRSHFSFLEMGRKIQVLSLFVFLVFSLEIILYFILNRYTLNFGMPNNQWTFSILIAFITGVYFLFIIVLLFKSKIKLKEGE